MSKSLLQKHLLLRLKGDEKSGEAQDCYEGGLG
jgi:hypothetical protein